ncbi:PnuC-like nicotinamide mononucleotide transport [Aeromonas phage BUCT695]|uniref:PnuC-like nicotinamide mononucleotide transport n=1 Tax=Aeromonas phage BUCT695 TaxID=2908630 RepID=UPI002329283B|nr:PnuC-like nicotinamide mononucleotide transport [Aeromonas phage BUCT695]UIW10579.1 nicotinamide ribonucleoside or mononucleotide transporter [Aeromonas phage BUCT695]
MLKKIWTFMAPVIVLITAYLSHATIDVIVASGVGCIFVLGVAYGFAWTNLLGAALAAFYAYLSYHAGYYANMVINGLIVVPMQIYAYFYWDKLGDLHCEMSRRGKLLMCSLVTSGIIVGSVITLLCGSQMWFHDAASSVLLISGTFMLMMKFKEQWFAWIPYNFLEVWMWFTAASIEPSIFAIFMMRLVFFINSLFGYHEWFVRSKEE